MEAVSRSLAPRVGVFPIRFVAVRPFTALHSIAIHPLAVRFEKLA